MAELNAEFHILKPSLSLLNPDMELLNNLSSFENNMNSNMPINESFMDHHHEIPNLSIGFGEDNTMNRDPHYGGVFCEAAMTTQFLPSHDILSPSGSRPKTPKENKNTVGGRKRKRNTGSEDLEKPRDVIHVRAKRGQATDSHSLAERLRREKINEKLRSLQDLVPGCYKTMGMAVMLDVIINYVRSLQNQIDFLSMKLSAASLYYDFNSEMEVMETTQGTSGYEAPVMEPIVGEGYGVGGGENLSYFP